MGGYFKTTKDGRLDLCGLRWGPTGMGLHSKGVGPPGVHPPLVQVGKGVKSPNRWGPVEKGQPLGGGKEGGEGKWSSLSKKKKQKIVKSVTFQNQLEVKWGP